MKALTLLLTCLLTLASCSFFDEPFEPDWHTNVFRCKINGTDWRSYCVSVPLLGCSASDCQYYLDTRYLSISASHSLGAVDQAMRFTASPAPSGQSVSLRDAGYGDYNLPSPFGHYELDTTANHHVTILEVDTINHTIMGTFAFTCINPDVSRLNKIVITDGYFHMNYRF